MALLGKLVSFTDENHHLYIILNIADQLNRHPNYVYKIEKIYFTIFFLIIRLKTLTVFFSIVLSDENPFNIVINYNYM